MTNLLQLTRKMGGNLVNYFADYGYDPVRSSSKGVRRETVPLSIFGGSKIRAKGTRDRAGKQQALVLAAQKLFASKGYEATTTREIAAGAGCAEGLIHRYFSGKAGLLSAIIKFRVSQEVADLTHHLPPAESFEDEYLELVHWAVEHIWEDREFLRVAIPRALLDPEFGKVLREIGPQQRGRAIRARLKKFGEGRALPDLQFDALVESVSVIGFMFGFMRPAVLRQDRKTAARTATVIAKLLSSGLFPARLARRKAPQKSTHLPNLRYSL